MPTKSLFQEDAYRQNCQAVVIAANADGIVLDQTVFYPRGGGQPGDTGTLVTADGGETAIIDTRKVDHGEILHIPAEGAPLPPAGAEVEARIDWQRRYRHMRMHTCLHLVGAVIPHPVTGGNINAEKSRLDFNLPDPPDKAEVNTRLNELIAAGHEVTTRWITGEELDRNPDLVRTMSVSPPRGAGRVRLLEIKGVDLQPCGGTHVRRTSEIGRAVVTKIESKGRQNRRVHVVLPDEN